MFTVPILRDRGVFDVGRFGQDYDRPNEFGVAFGQGTFESPDKYGIYTPQLSDWIFWGHESKPMGFADEQDNALMYLISYKLEADAANFDQFDVVSSGFFNFNNVFANGEIRVNTQLSSSGGSLIGEGSLVASDNLNGRVRIPAFGNEIWVDTYVMLWGEEASDSSGIEFTSLWNEFQPMPVPEPVSGTILLAIGATLLLRRRRQR